MTHDDESLAVHERALERVPIAPSMIGGVGTRVQRAGLLRASVILRALARPSAWYARDGMGQAAAMDAGRWAWQTRWACGALASLVLGACALDTYGVGSGSGAMPGATDDTSTASGASDASTAAGSGQADDAVTVGATDGADDASSSGVDDEGDDATTGPPVDPCEAPAPVTFEIDVTQAVIAAPMQLDVSVSEGPYAYSEVANQGQASFQFLVPCQAEFRVWARVYDPGVGADGLTFTDPDSYLVAFDGEADTEWWYGCQTYDADLFGSVWAWEPVRDNPICIDGDFRRTLSPGTHLLHLTNREAGNHASANVAAVARVVVTSDPAYAPPS